MSTALAVLSALSLALWWTQRSEIRYLRQQLAQRREHEHRVERASAGLPEAPVEPATPLPPLSPHHEGVIDQLVGAWGAQETQKGFRDDVLEWRREGKSGEWIVGELRRQMED